MRDLENLRNREQFSPSFVVFTALSVSLLHAGAMLFIISIQLASKIQHPTVEELRYITTAGSGRV